MSYDDQSFPDEITDSHRVDRRKVVAGLAGAGLAVGAGMTRVFAQDSTPTASDGSDAGSSSDSGSTSTDDGTSMKAEEYQTFVAALATAMNSDADTVDAAIRTALTQMVDDTLAAGDISANDAAARKEKIASSDAPISASSGGNHGSGGMGGPGDGGGNQKPGSMGGSGYGGGNPPAKSNGDGGSSDDSTPTAEGTVAA